jgi:hypothetical protein
MKAFLAASAWFAGAVLLVIGSVAALFWIGALQHISIVFYRGLALIGIAEVFCFGLLWLACGKWPIWKMRDVVSACAFAAGVAVCFLIVLPVTIDRSISTFILTQMAAQPDRAFTPAELREVFVEVYVDRYGQVERRLQEQEISGNVSPATRGFQITPQGLAFVRFARLLSRVFQTDPRFVSPADAPEAGASPAPPPVASTPWEPPWTAAKVP